MAGRLVRSKSDLGKKSQSPSSDAKEPKSFTRNDINDSIRNFDAIRKKREGDKPNSPKEDQKTRLIDDVLREHVQNRQKDIDKSSNLKGLDLAFPKQQEEISRKNRPVESSDITKVLDLAEPKRSEEAPRSKFMDKLEDQVQKDKQSNELQKRPPEEKTSDESDRSKKEMIAFGVLDATASIGKVVGKNLSDALGAIGVQGGGGLEKPNSLSPADMAAMNDLKKGNEASELGNTERAGSSKRKSSAGTDRTAKRPRLEEKEAGSNSRREEQKNPFLDEGIALNDLPSNDIRKNAGNHEIPKDDGYESD